MTISPPLISIIVPVYKTPADLLRQFLRSVTEQTLAEIEIIIVDDASSDHCPAMLDEFAAKDGRVTVIHRTENGRAGAARNDGLDVACGEYILFADADDFMQPDMCEVLYDLADKQDADIVACGYAIVDSSGNESGVKHLEDRCYDLSLARQRADGYRSLNFALWNKIFRRSCIDSLRFELFEANIGEDTLFNVAVFCRSKSMVTTSYVGYCYTVHADSATGRASKGIAYLHSIVDSGDHIKSVIAINDQSLVGKKHSDLIALRRFTTGCEWIAESPKSEERDALWLYWKRHLRDKLLPSLYRRGLLATWYRFVVASFNPNIAFRLTRLACGVEKKLNR